MFHLEKKKKIILPVRKGKDADDSCKLLALVEVPICHYSQKIKNKGNEEKDKRRSDIYYNLRSCYHVP